MDRRITIDPKVCQGQACIKGTRISVYQILRILAHGETIEALLEEYPSLPREDILACLDYDASLAEEQVTPLEVLRARHEDPCRRAYPFDDCASPPSSEP